MDVKQRFNINQKPPQLNPGPATTKKSPTVTVTVSNYYRLKLSLSGSAPPNCSLITPTVGRPSPPTLAVYGMCPSCSEGLPRGYHSCSTATPCARSNRLLLKTTCDKAVRSPTHTLQAVCISHTHTHTHARARAHTHTPRPCAARSSIPSPRVTRAPNLDHSREFLLACTADSC